MKTLVNIRFAEAEPTRGFIELGSVTGVYESYGEIITISFDEGELIATIEEKVMPSPLQKWCLKVIDKQTAAAYSEEGERQGNLTFLERDEQGLPEYLYMGFRLHQRVRNEDFYSDRCRK